MQAFIVGDHEPLADLIRETLRQEGHDCPPGQVLPLAQADRLSRVHFELLVVVLSPDPERALAAAADLQVAASVKVVVVGPGSDSRLVLRALRGGASDYVDEAALEDELPTALRRLRAEVAAPAEPGRTIAVLAASGGSGSSTLAANLATVLAQGHTSSLLVDLKLETGDLAALLDLRPAHTLADVCQNLGRLDRVMFERSLVRHGSGVHLLAPPRIIADVRQVTPEGVRQALCMGRALFPYVVVDLDHTFREEQCQVLRQVDVVLLVLRLEFTALRNTQRALDYLERQGVRRDQVRVVVNRYGQPKEVPAAKAEEALGMKVSHFIPDDPRTVNRANNNGVPVVLESPSAKVSRVITQLAAGVNGRQTAQ
jgi:pilus assembly protein CpaE